MFDKNSSDNNNNNNNNVIINCRYCNYRCRYVKMLF